MLARLLESYIFQQRFSRSQLSREPYIGGSIASENGPNRIS